MGEEEKRRKGRRAWRRRGTSHLDHVKKSHILIVRKLMQKDKHCVSPSEAPGRMELSITDPNDSHSLCFVPESSVCILEWIMF